MADLNSFSKRMTFYAKSIDKNSNKTVRLVALAVDRDLVLATPVDTGRARSNWVVNIDSPFMFTKEPYSPGEAGSTASENTRAAIAQAEAEISRRRSEQDIYISNNLDYIDKLNKGSSAQAPAQFVEMAVQSALALVRKARILGNGN